jgi:hypothetical protein
MQGIILFPEDEKGIFSVCLMKLKAEGEIDWDDEGFVLIFTKSRDSALSYATELGTRLGLAVLDIQKS